MDTSVQHAESAIAEQAGDDAPLSIGVTGHRDLVPEEMAGIRDKVRELLEDLA